ncbi:MAG: hypothetical protein ACON32_17440 [Pirellulaceae bacterium]
MMVQSSPGFVTDWGAAVESPLRSEMKVVKTTAKSDLRLMLLCVMELISWSAKKTIRHHRRVFPARQEPNSR